jgi:hypothetical protein
MKKRYVNFLFATLLIVVSGRLAFGVIEEKKECQQTDEQPKNSIARKGLAQKWLWNSAKVVGAVAVVGVAVYSFFQTSPATTLMPLPITGDDVSLPLLSSHVEPKHVPNLTKEQYEKYKNASNAYGMAAGWFSLVALIDPFFVPYAAVTYLGSFYYGVKALQPKLK